MEWAERLRELVVCRARALDAADDAQEALYGAMLDAQEAGASYREIAEATGLSRIRVGQVLKLERERRRRAA